MAQRVDDGHIKQAQKNQNAEHLDENALLLTFACVVALVGWGGVRQIHAPPFKYFCHVCASLFLCAIHLVCMVRIYNGKLRKSKLVKKSAHSFSIYFLFI